MLDLKYYELN